MIQGTKDLVSGPKTLPRSSQTTGRIFDSFLLLFPRAFREAFGEEMREVFALRHQEILSRHSGAIRRASASAGLLLRTGLDAIRTAVLERINSSLPSPKGNLDPKDSNRPPRGRLLAWLKQDVVQAGRMLRKQPGFSLVVVITLALGIGANTALFSVLHGVLLSPLPYPDSEELVLIFEWNTELGWTHNALPAATVRDYREGNRSFQAFGSLYNTSATLTGEGDPERATLQVVTHEVLPLLGARSHLGELFRPEHENPGQDRVIVLSHGLWQRRFGGDPAIIGRGILLDGDTHTVIGVLPDGFRPVQGSPAAWVPLGLSETRWADRRNHFLIGVGRLRAGLDAAGGEADLTGIARQLEEEFPEEASGQMVNVESLREAVVGEVVRPLWLMMGAAVLVLLIACANVANLFLSRGLARERELAIRAALGAGRRRILHLLTTESLFLGLLGGGVGVVLAYLGLKLLLVLEPGNLPRVEEISLQGWVLAFSLFLTLGTAILFGVIPAILTSRSQLAGAATEGTPRSTQGITHRRIKNTLAVLQMAIAVVLLAGAGLFTRSFSQLQRVDAGFETENILQAGISLSGGAYGGPEEILRFHEGLVAGLERAPGVTRAALISNPPLTMAPQISLQIQGRETEGEELQVVSRLFASEGYFDLLGLTLLEGRTFNGEDRLDSPFVVVVSESMALRHWPEESPLGQMIRVGGPDSPPMAVIGVVSDLRQYGIRYRPFPSAFIPTSQVPVPGFTVMLKTTEIPGDAVGHLRSVLKDLDPSLPFSRLRTMDEVVAGNVAGPRFAMFLAGVFGLLSLALAAVGIYGVLAYSVSLRTREVGIRLALGAESSRVVLMILRQGMTLASAALLLGIPSAYFLSRMLESLLFQVAPADPITFGGIFFGILLVALLACYVPAARAGRLSPLEALKLE